jgi:Rieske Fe-S protein
MINRRTMLKHTALVGAALATNQTIPLAMAQRKFEPVKIGELAKLDKENATLTFSFDGQSAIVTRVAKPAKVSERVLEFKHQDATVYLAAYNLACTHAGCEVDKPNQDLHLDCPCHGSRFAVDGTVIAGPARQPLRAIGLKLEDGVLYAVDYLAVK